MKKSTMSILLIGILTLFAGCILVKDQEEDCAEGERCDTEQVSENNQDQTQDSEPNNENPRDSLSQDEDSLWVDKDSLVMDGPDAWACFEIYAPVCGDDGKTYSNECYAKKGGVESFTEGKCEEEQTSGFCTKEYAPVCGDNGVTYGNACTAKADGVTDFTEGECRVTEECPVFVRDPMDIQCPEGSVAEPIYDDSKCLVDAKCKVVEDDNFVICTTEYAPVCGSDGKTYSNPCSAKGAGVEDFTEGECNEPEVLEPVCQTKGQFGPKTETSQCWDEFDEKGCYVGSACY